MSIINQTLRALDARQPNRAPLDVPLPPPPAIGTRRNAKLWGVAAVLLPIAGLAIWFITRPVAEDLPHPRVAARQQAVLPPAMPAPAEKPAPHAQPAPLPVVLPPVVLPPAEKPASFAQPAPHPVVLPAPRTQSASPPAKIEVTPAMAEKSPGSTLANAGEQSPAAASLPTLPARNATTDLPGRVVARRPPISKEVSQPTAGEEADERYRKALALIQAGQVEQALALLKGVLALSPGHVAARETLATSLSDAGRNQEAEQVLRTGRAINPEHAWFALSLARLQAARGDTAGAVASLQSGLEGRGVDADYHATLAALLMRLKQYPEAAQQYEQALKRQPGQGTWWMGLGLTLDAQGKNDEARSAYRRALAAGNLSDTLEAFARTKLPD